MYKDVKYVKIKGYSFEFIIDFKILLVFLNNNILIY